MAPAAPGCEPGGARAGRPEPPVFDVNWFSDGGLTANLPVQFFDSPLPTRPTFAIDLAGFSADHPRSADERENSYLPTVNQGGLHRRTARWEPEAAVAAGLLRDVPGRDRADLGRRGLAGHARLPRPGGDGLPGRGRGRPQPVDAARRWSTALSQRGRFAAARLVERFGPGRERLDQPPLAPVPRRHRRAQRLARRLRGGLTRLRPTRPTTPMLADPDDAALVPDHRGDELAAVRERTERLRTEIADWAAEPADAFTANRPKQPPSCGSSRPPTGRRDMSPPRSPMGDRFELEAALAYPEPRRRSLQIYAVDPMIARLAGNEVVTITVPYEPLRARTERRAGPGHRLRRAPSGFYTPVDLDDPILLAQDGLTPERARPALPPADGVRGDQLAAGELRARRWAGGSAGAGEQAAAGLPARIPGRERGLRRRPRRLAALRLLPHRSAQTRAATCPGSGCSAACPTTSSCTRRRTPWSIGCARSTRRPPTSTCTPSTRASPTWWPCSSTSRCPTCWPATSSQPRPT